MNWWRHEHRVRIWPVLGAMVLSGLVGFAAGNGHTTRSALKGSERWWQHHAREREIGQMRTDWRDCQTVLDAYVAAEDQRK